MLSKQDAFHEFWPQLGMAKETAMQRARNLAGKLGGDWASQGAQGSVRALEADFHSYLPKVFKRAVGAA